MIQRSLLVTALTALTAAAAAATAHDPRFDDDTLWSHLTGHEAYVDHAWGPGRVLVWAHPGEDGNRRRHDPSKIENWTVAGSDDTTRGDDPVGGRRTDLVLPDADRPYTVVIRGDPWSVIRHVTVGRNAKLEMALDVYGNLWAKPGGMLSVEGTPARLRGGAHTFVRNDNPAPPPSLEHFRDLRQGLVFDWLAVQKPGGSTEFLGHILFNDEVKFDEGLAVIGPGSTLDVGPMSIQLVGPEATLRLMSGASFAKRRNFGRESPDFLVHGHLEAGSPERPLTADAVLGISVKDSDHALDPQDMVGIDEQGWLGPKTELMHQPYGLIVAEAGALKVHSSDPRSARLVVRWHGHADSEGAASSHHTIRAAFLGDVDLNGVLIDHAAAGGIALPDGASPRHWPLLQLGPACAAGPQALFTAYRPAQAR